MSVSPTKHDTLRKISRLEVILLEHYCSCNATSKFRYKRRWRLSLLYFFVNGYMKQHWIKKMPSKPKNFICVSWVTRDLAKHTVRMQLYIHLLLPARQKKERRRIELLKLKKSMLKPAWKSMSLLWTLFSYFGCRKENIRKNMMLKRGWFSIIAWKHDNISVWLIDYLIPIITPHPRFLPRIIDDSTFLF